jgi:Protein of unknown function (DUF1493)
MNNRFEELKKFVLKNSIAEESELSRSTIVDTDLYLRGDDGIEFILKYAKHFNVDVSNFMAADYFEAEGGNILFFDKPSELKNLTLGDLEKGILSGKLDERIINSF